MDWSWAVEGVTEDMPRTTGPECAYFVPVKRKIIESIIITSICLLSIKLAVRRLQPIDFNFSHQQQQNLENTHRPGKQILLVIMTFVLGMELGFKFATKTVIFAFNPCHITTIMQIYILASKPSKTTIALFKIQMNLLNGPLLAFVFPDADSRRLPMEATTYWIQHGLMFVITIYLLRLGGPYQMESIFDFKWNIIGYASLITYHFVVLQTVSVISHVNLNQMLCAAESDPFDGPNYRIAAFIHQAILCPILCKLFTILFQKSNKHQIQIQIQSDGNLIENNSQMLYSEYDNHSIADSRYDEEIMTTKID